MKELLLGVGMQGKAALHDLVHSEVAERVIAADRDIKALQAHVEGTGYGAKVQCEYVDAARTYSINHLMEHGADVVIDLLPVPFNGSVAAANDVPFEPFAQELRKRDIKITSAFNTSE